MQTGPQLAIPRATTEDLAMQVLTGGKWHRRTINLAMTACAEHKIHSEFCPLRPESYEGPLCPSCFTRYELALSAELEHANRLKNGG